MGQGGVQLQLACGASIHSLPVSLGQGLGHQLPRPPTRVITVTPVQRGTTGLPTGAGASLGMPLGCPLPLLTGPDKCHGQPCLVTPNPGPEYYPTLRFKDSEGHLSAESWGGRPWKRKCLAWHPERLPPPRVQMLGYAFGSDIPVPGQHPSVGSAPGEPLPLPAFLSRLH